MSIDFFNSDLPIFSYKKDTVIVRSFTKVMMAIVLFLFAMQVQGQADFITTWKTNNPGITDSTSIRIPTKPDLAYNYDVDWDNDGVYDEFGITDSVTHDFGVPGTYTIRIRGDFRWIYFEGNGDKEKLLDVSQWGDIPWKSMVKAFQGCKNLNISATDAPDLSQVANMTNMFGGCTAFNSPIDHWDVSNVEIFYFCFSNCKNFNQPLNNWNTSSATSLDRMFSGCTSFNQPIGNWDVSNVTNYGAMFQNCQLFNQPIGNWDVSSAKIMGALFNGASSFNQDIGNWDVSNVFNMKIIFHKAAAFNQDIGNWDVGNVTNLASAFKGAQNFNQDIGNWNVSKVTNISWLFAGAALFNQDIGDWDVSQVTNMNYVFFYAKAFNQDISNWDVSNATVMANMFKASPFNQDIGNWEVGKVTNMNSMFEASTNFDQDIGNWNVSNLESADRMFNLTKLSIANYDSLLIGWNKLDLKNDVLFHGGTSIYCAGGAARAYMMTNKNWIIQDSGAERVVPLALCKDLTLYLEQDGSLDIEANALDNGSFDLCTPVLLSASKLSFTCADVGMLVDTLTVLDENGNSNFCISTITLEDAPLNFVCPPDITVNANAANCQAVVNWDAPRGNCRTTIAASYNSGDTFTLGTTTVSYEATDDFSNTTNCSFTITVQSDLMININNAIPPSCFNAQDGQLLVDIQGGNAPYAIDWNNDGLGDYDDPEDLNNLSAGNYVLHILDNYGCSSSESFTLSEPNEVEINITNANNPSCFNSLDGAIAVNIDGGTTPYIYDWSLDGTDVNDDAPGISGLGAGAYTIQITDAAGCLQNETILLSQPDELIINTDNSSEPKCFAAQDGLIDISIAGGTAPYIYDWDIDGMGDNDDLPGLSDLGAGAYTIQITDAAGCLQNETILLSQPNPLIINTENSSEPKCFDSQDGQINVSIAGGTAPYIYDWDIDGMGDQDDLPNLSDLGPGTYTIQITDAEGCLQNETLLLNQPNELIINTENSSEPTCFGALDGQIDISIAGGTAPYIYDWDNDGMGDQDDEPGVSGLGAGTYHLQITDVAGCLQNETILLNQPPGLALSSTIIESDLGQSMQIDLTVNGGTPAYFYDWGNDGIGNNEDIEVTESGTYQVLVQDLNGCTSSLEVAVEFELIESPCAENKLNIYPNPNAGLFKVQFDGCPENGFIAIYDVLGQKIYSEASSGLGTLISLETLPGGTYYVKLSSGEDSFVRPVVVLAE